MSIDFDSLLEGINKKDMRAWEELYAGYYAVLCSYVNNILRDRDQAQDIVQDVLVAVWKSSKQFGDMKELTSYLYRACYNNALIYKRNVQIRKDIEQKIVLETEVEFSDVPSQVNTVPCRAFRLGITQSNISTPLATASMMLDGVPTPIR